MERSRMISRKLWQFLVTLICGISACFAQPVNRPLQEINTKCVTCNNVTCAKCLDPVEAKAFKEHFIPLPYIAIAFYKPNYALPFYYTGSPYNAVYANLTPSKERIKSSEAKYQVSLKVPIWKNILDYDSSLYFGYTLRTYFQAYTRSTFIRETDYEPDIFIQNIVNCPLINDWYFNFFNFGYIHQSNGYGNSEQRSWDRIYVEAITSTDNWRISLRPWVIAAKNSRNTNIGTYLGYAQFVVAFKFYEQVLSFEIPNLFASPKRTSGILTWSFPITPYLKGYAQVFSGYGQSLIEFNHRTNSAGIGIALSDWI